MSAIINIIISCIYIHSIVITDVTAIPSQSTHIHSVHRIAFGSCYNPLHSNLSGKIWTTIQSHNPNQVILLGDNIYADKRVRAMTFLPGDPQRIKELYDKFQNTREWKELYNKLTIDGVEPWGNTIHATLDDHDYGQNNADKTYIYRNESQQLHWDFIHTPIDSIRRKQNAVYKSKVIIEPTTGFIYKIILLDTRSNKDNKKTIYGDFLGIEQWKWLAKELVSTISIPILKENNNDSNSNISVTKEMIDVLPDLILVGSSIQILPSDKYIEENWNEFPMAREKLLHMLYYTQQLTNVLLLSGDVHSGEFLQAKCSVEPQKNQGHRKYSHLMEFTSSGLSHSVTRIYSDPSTERKAKSKSYRDTIIENTEESIIANIKPDVKPRGWYVQLGNDFYQALGSHAYRQHRYKDYYQGLNFGLIDIQSIDIPTTLDEVDNNDLELTVEKNFSHNHNHRHNYNYKLDLHIMDHVGGYVQTRTMNLVQPVMNIDTIEFIGEKVDAIAITEYHKLEREVLSTATSNTAIEIYSRMNSTITKLYKLFVTITGGYLSPHSICQPLRGPVPEWRKILFDVIIAFILLCVIVIPILTIIWFIIASIWYIFYESEQRRRERLLALHIKRD